MTNLEVSVSEAGSLVRRTASSCVAALGVALVPKCPLCVAAYLAGFGLSASVASTAAPFVRPAAWLLLLIACATLFSVWRGHARAARRPRRSRDQTTGCCEQWESGPSLPSD